ncbi:MAG: hypothetical protein ACOYBW_11455 [Fluviibacter phosphoraccumulans]
MKILIATLIMLTSLIAQAKDVTNCVQQGNRLSCVSETLEEANTPPTYNKLGSGEWCLVSKAPLPKYNCGYQSFERCQADANIDNLYKPVPVASCIRNSR